MPILGGGSCEKKNCGFTLNLTTSAKHIFSKKCMIPLYTKLWSPVESLNASFEGSCHLNPVWTLAWDLLNYFDEFSVGFSDVKILIPTWAKPERKTIPFTGMRRYLSQGGLSQCFTSATRPHQHIFSMHQPLYGSPKKQPRQGDISPVTNLEKSDQFGVKTPTKIIS